MILTKINPVYERFRPRAFQRGVERPKRVSFREVGAVFGSQQNGEISLLLDISYYIMSYLSRVCEKIQDFCFDCLEKTRNNQNFSFEI